MKSREEILRRIKVANSWRETGVTLNEAYKAFSADSEPPDVDQVKELKEKIKRLTDANKKLREENSALNGGKKK